MNLNFSETIHEKVLKTIMMSIMSRKLQGT